MQAFNKTKLDAIGKTTNWVEASHGELALAIIASILG